jgi:hypothetical protein
LGEKTEKTSFGKMEKQLIEMVELIKNLERKNGIKTIRKKFPKIVPCIKV